jgi:tRNA G18 (ribose-2'-O)-methylase SpoU
MNAADEPLNQHDEADHTVGVGPWVDSLPSDLHFDQELLRDGDRRNVVDEYRYWSMDAIIADLDTKRFPFHIAIENLEHDMNIGSIVRSANAFMAKEVHIIGKRRWNRRGAMVTDRYQHVTHHEDIAAFGVWAKEQKLEVIGIDNLPGSVPIETFDLPRECVLLFGQEGRGLSPEAGELVTSCLSIAQFGSTRSINAGAAAAIAMHAWIRRNVFNQNVN